MNIRQVPWDFVPEGTPETGVPNMPSPEGIELGIEVARLTDGIVKDGHADGRCATCAFRLGTFPNGCAPTLMDAMKCALEGTTTFLCHEDGEPCGGWVLWRAKEIGDA